MKTFNVLKLKWLFLLVFIFVMFGFNLAIYASISIFPNKVLATEPTENALGSTVYFISTSKDFNKLSGIDFNIEAYISFESFMEEEFKDWVAEFDNDITELFVYNIEARIVKKYTEKDEIEIQSYLENKNYILFTSEEELREYLNNERLLSYSEVEQIFKKELEDSQEFSAFTNNLLNLIEQKLCQTTTKWKQQK